MRKQAKICILLNSLLHLILNGKTLVLSELMFLLLTYQGLCKNDSFSEDLQGRKPQSAVSRGSCLQHHTREDIWVLGVLPGIPENAPYKINDLLLTARNEKQKQEIHAQLNGNKKKNHGEKKWIPALWVILVPVNLVPKVTSYINIFIYTSDPFPFCYLVHVSFKQEKLEKHKYTTMTQEWYFCYLIHHLDPSDGEKQYSIIWTKDAFDDVAVCDCLFYINQYKRNYFRQCTP